MNDVRSQCSWSTRHSAPGMAPTAAEIEAVERCGVSGATGNRPCDELIQAVFAVVNVPACQTITLFDVHRRQDFATDDKVPGSRCIPFELIDYRVAECLPRAIGPALFEVMRRKMYEHRDDAVSLRRQVWPGHRRYMNVEHRPFGTLPVLDGVKGALKIVEFFACADIFALLTGT